MKNNMVNRDIIRESIRPVNPKTGQAGWWHISIAELITLVLLCIVLEIAVFSIEQAKWISPQPALTIVLLLSVLSAFVLGKSRLPIVVTWIIAIILGILVAMWQISGFFSSSGMMSMTGELIAAVKAFIQNTASGLPAESNLQFVIFLVISVWICGYISAWYCLRRRNAFVAVTLGALITLVNLGNLTEKYYLSFFFYIAAALILIAQVNLSKFTFQTGINGKTVINNRRLLLILGMVCALSMVMTSIVWFLPKVNTLNISAMVNKSLPFTDDVDGFLRKFLAKVPPKLPYILSDSTQFVSFTDEINHNNDVEFIISSEKPFYWRTHIYDKYVSTGWTNSPTIKYSIEQIDNTQNNENSVPRTKFTYTVVNKLKTDMLLTAGKVVSLNIPFSVQALEPMNYHVNLLRYDTDEYFPPDINELVQSIRSIQGKDRAAYLSEIKNMLPYNLTLKSMEEISTSASIYSRRYSNSYPFTSIDLIRKSPNNLDILSFSAAEMLNLDQQYAVTIYIEHPTSEQLTGAGDKYPAEITDYYLQLPPDLPQNLIELSQSIAGGAGSPYAKVLAIKQFLAQIPYVEDAGAPPPEEDGVDYFLNTLKTGNCFYFASAEAVLLRALGVPARMVVGYLPRQWDEKKGITTISSKDYHAWVEVYFPSYGWIEFEVTPSSNSAVTSLVTNTGNTGNELSLPASEEPLVAEPGSEEMPISNSSYKLILPKTTDINTQDANNRLTMDEESIQNNENLQSNSLNQSGFLLAIVLIMVIITLSIFIIFYLVIRRYRSLEYSLLIYRKLCFVASLSRAGPQPYQTPREYAAKLTTIFPAKRESVNYICQTFAEIRYGHDKYLDNSKKERLRLYWSGIKADLWKNIFKFW